MDSGVGLCKRIADAIRYKKKLKTRVWENIFDKLDKRISKREIGLYYKYLIGETN